MGVAGKSLSPRREHDKGPEAFVEALCELHQLGLPFHVSFLGQSFSQLPREESASSRSSACTEGEMGHCLGDDLTTTTCISCGSRNWL